MGHTLGAFDFTGALVRLTCQICALSVEVGAGSEVSGPGQQRVRCVLVWYGWVAASRLRIRVLLEQGQLCGPPALLTFPSAGANLSRYNTNPVVSILAC